MRLIFDTKSFLKVLRHFPHHCFNYLQSVVWSVASLGAATAALVASPHPGNPSNMWPERKPFQFLSRDSQLCRADSEHTNRSECVAVFRLSHNHLHRRPSLLQTQHQTYAQRSKESLSVPAIISKFSDYLQDTATKHALARMDVRKLVVTCTIFLPFYLMDHSNYSDQIVFVTFLSEKPSR